MFPTVDIAQKSIGYPFVFYLFALSNSCVIILLCQKLSFLYKLFGFWGQNSLIVMAIHMDITIEIAYLILSRVPFSFDSTLNSVFAVIIEFMLLFLIVLFINRFAPFLYRWPKAKEKHRVEK